MTRSEYYSNNLSNFKTVLKDTDEDIIYRDEDDYNCMGYALGTFEWEELDTFFVWWDEEDGKDILEDMILDCVGEIEKRFDFVHCIESPEDVRENEYVVAFKVGYDDFHFMRQNSDGSWTHKRGGSPIEEISEEEVFSQEWGIDKYISRTYYFSVRYQHDL